MCSHASNDYTHNTDADQDAIDDQKVEHLVAIARQLFEDFVRLALLTGSLPEERKAEVIQVLTGFREQMAAVQARARAGTSLLPPPNDTPPNDTPPKPPAPVAPSVIKRFFFVRKNGTVSPGFIDLPTFTKRVNQQTDRIAFLVASDLQTFKTLAELQAAMQ